MWVHWGMLPNALGPTYNPEVSACVELNYTATLSDGIVVKGCDKFKIYLTCLTIHKCKYFLIVPLKNQYCCFLVRDTEWFDR